jgi:FAD/FMN-containing dehydrogenase
MVVENFGRNIRFEPANILSPKTSEQIIEYLNEQRPRQVRVIASSHSWSPLIETKSTLIDLEQMNEVNIFEEAGESLVRVGAGCQIKRLIDILNKAGLTLPSLGLITEQTIAGAISTGTHGSGKNSLSHYVKEVSLISYQNQSDTASLSRITQGPDLEAARCSLGCLGIIVEVVLPCIPQYMVTEKWTSCTTLSAALAREKDSPLQQFFLLPHRWSYFCQERTVSKRGTNSGINRR